MKLSTVQADAMQELGNIGAAHAATTLSQMLGEYRPDERAGNQGNRHS